MFAVGQIKHNPSRVIIILDVGPYLDVDGHNNIIVNIGYIIDCLVIKVVNLNSGCRKVYQCIGKGCPTNK